MKAFLDSVEVKEKYLARVHAHAKADEFIKGIYWEGGKGCAVGCTIHSDDHAAYEDELGIPKWLAHLEDTIFEGLPNERAKIWPVEFLEAVNVGADLNSIKSAFMIFTLEESLKTFDHAKFPQVLKAVTDVKTLWRKYPHGRDESNRTEWREAADAAYVAYVADAAYASYVAYAAYVAYVANTAYAARATDATYAAYVAYVANTAYAARAAYAAADAAASSRAAADDERYLGRQAQFVVFANELLKLIRGCK